MYLRAFRLDPPRRLQPIYTLHVDVKEHNAAFPHIPHIRIKLLAGTVFPYFKIMPAGFQQRPQRTPVLPAVITDRYLHRISLNSVFISTINYIGLWGILSNPIARNSHKLHEMTISVQPILVV